MPKVLFKFENEFGDERIDDINVGTNLPDEIDEIGRQRAGDERLQYLGFEFADGDKTAS